MTAHLAGVLADRDSWPATRCSAGRALEVVGTRSAMLLLREAYYGATRFDEFTRRTGFTDAVASARLRELVDAGLFTREPYQEPGQRTRYRYVLTEMGRDLLPVMLGLLQWGDKYLAEDGGPLRMSHTDCRADVHVEIRCGAGHEVALEELTVSARRPR